MRKSDFGSPFFLHFQNLVPHEDLRYLMEDLKRFQRNFVDSLKLENFTNELLNEWNVLSVTSSDIDSQTIVSNLVNICNCESIK